MNTKKRIIIAGGSGYLGKALAAHFHKDQLDVVILTRTPNAGGNSVRELAWDGRTLGLWQSELEGTTALINLTGKSINCRYTTRNRKAILESRICSTRVLGEATSRCHKPPAVWLNAGTATIYKHTFDQPMDEAGEIRATAEAKDEFSLEVANAWERALAEAQTPATRKVALRMTMVLGLGNNSVFPVLRRLVRFGLGGRMGSGDQYVSWIHELDFCRAVEWLIDHQDFTGPVNIAGPNPVPNREMMQTLRHVCRVPFGLLAASWMLEIGAFFLRTETELIVKSRRVVPRRLLESGFRFLFPSIRQAFEDLTFRQK